jgi:hypothetical protein
VARGPCDYVVAARFDRRRAPQRSFAQQARRSPRGFRPGEADHTRCDRGAGIDERVTRPIRLARPSRLSGWPVVVDAVDVRRAPRVAAWTLIDRIGVGIRVRVRSDAEQSSLPHLYRSIRA